MSPRSRFSLRVGRWVRALASSRPPSRHEGRPRPSPPSEDPLSHRHAPLHCRPSSGTSADEATSPTAHTGGDPDPGSEEAQREEGRGKKKERGERKGGASPPAPGEQASDPRDSRRVRPTDRWKGRSSGPGKPGGEGDLLGARAVAFNGLNSIPAKLNAHAEVCQPAAGRTDAEGNAVAL